MGESPTKFLYKSVVSTKFLYKSVASLDSEQQVPVVPFPENFSTMQAPSLVADGAVSSVIMNEDTAPRGAFEVAPLAGHAAVSILSSDTAASLSLQGTELHADEAAHRSQLGVAGWRHAQQHASMASEPVLGFGAPNAAGGQVQSAKHKIVPGSPKPIMHGQPIMQAQRGTSIGASCKYDVCGLQNLNLSTKGSDVPHVDIISETPVQEKKNNSLVMR
jgi:hypothetical protein